MKDCKSFRVEIEEAGLSPETRSHAATCASCAMLGRERESLQLLVGSLERVEAPADFESRLRTRINSSRGNGGKHNFINWGFTPGLAWAAAACLLVVSASLYILQERRNSEASRQAPTNKGSGTLVEKASVTFGSTETDPAFGQQVKGETTVVMNASKKIGDNHRHFVPRTSSREIASKENRIKAAQGGSSDFGIGVAQILRLQKIPLASTPESIRFVVTDEQGNTRPVPMRAVSFGSQELVAGANQRTHIVSNEKGGVW